METHLKLVSHNFRDWAVQAHEHGFGIKRQIYRPNPTALEVCEQYYFAKKNGWLSKEDEVNYNNRWMQFRGTSIGQFNQCARFMNQHFQCNVAHIYANWKMDGHNYGRHLDDMPVILVQML